MTALLLAKLSGNPPFKVSLEAGFSRYYPGVLHRVIVQRAKKPGSSERAILVFRRVSVVLVNKYRKNWGVVGVPVRHIVELPLIWNIELLVDEDTQAIIHHVSKLAETGGLRAISDLE